jgi:predicted ATPase
VAERFDATDARRGGPLVEAIPDVASTELVRLPSPRTVLRGRDQEVNDLAGRLAHEKQLITITGAGGIGKSRLAVAAARAAEASFPDGVAFVDLARVTSDDHVLPAVAHALGIRSPGEHSYQEVVRMSLADRRMLLVLDNVEHVVGAAPDLGALLDATAVSILATSRMPLRLSGEVVVELGPLPAAAAEEVFIERARAVKPGFGRTRDNSDAVAAIVTALDGVPLAIELAAARMRVMTPAAVVDRLDHALPLLADGGRDLPERQRTIRATIEWSVRLLQDDSRRLLLRLGIFRSGFALEAAVWMAHELDTMKALEAVSELVEGNLVREQDHGERAWYTMPATIREYVREELDVAGLAEASDLHARFYLEFADRAGRGLTSPEQRLWMPRLVDERAELRAAIEHFIGSGQPDAAADCLWSLFWFWWAAGGLLEGRAWGQRLLALDPAPSLRSRAIATVYASAPDEWERVQEFSRPLARAAKVFRRDGDRFGEAMVLTELSVAKLIRRIPDYLGALRYMRRSHAMMEELRDPFGLSLSGTALGFLALLRRDFPGARRRTEEVLELARSNDNRFGQGLAHYQLGWVGVLSDDLHDALRHFREQLTVSIEIGADEGEALALEGLFAVAAKEGDIVKAGRFFGAAEVLRERKALYWKHRFFHGKILDEVGSGPDAAHFEGGRVAGRQADLDDVVALALASARDESLATSF